MIIRCLLISTIWALCFLSCNRGASQTISGFVVSEPTLKAIPYANVGLPKRHLGTVGDEQGRFQIDYNPAYGSDTVRISSVGFQPKFVLFSALLASPIISLSPDTVVMREIKVEVSSPYGEAHAVGLDRPNPKVSFHMISNELGTEIGSLIRLPRHPALLQGLHVVVAKNEAGPLTFRLNLYRVDGRGQPTAEKLINRDVLLTATPQAGVLTVDMTQDRIVLEEDFLLALEWVKGPAVSSADLAKKISFGGAMQYGGQLYMRPTSQAAWLRPTVKSNLPLMGKRPNVALYVTVKD